MSFSQDLWQANQALFQSTLELPFNQELAAGTLSQERFRHYMIQDAHYLVAYGRALAVTAAKSDNAEGVVQFANAANEAVVVERALHGGFMRDFGITPEQFAATPLTPACHHYTSYLLATAWSATYPVAVAALLPCFWIYAEVGRDIHARSAKDNPYQAWVDTYASEEFHAAVRGVCATVDRLAEETTEATRAAMHAAYKDAARLEWMFWDSAYRLADWQEALR
ncbi:thiaminase II [Comamonas sp. Y6]|uniref:Aminopyrimidine aminohydrolase n=1 Tax=Comamonas resistens TaxID=3046670 RepID=A0ABY8SN22_9BURK|nr:thiaminase II [Comamonas resistens]MDL5037640.1 thiaminase II [Comamonas resistens]WHS64323.1 thiaminase II [Comamonas resistens]